MNKNGSFCSEWGTLVWEIKGVHNIYIYIYMYICSPPAQDLPFPALHLWLLHVFNHLHHQCNTIKHLQAAACMTATIFHIHAAAGKIVGSASPPQILQHVSRWFATCSDLCACRSIEQLWSEDVAKIDQWSGPQTSPSRFCHQGAYAGTPWCNVVGPKLICRWSWPSSSCVLHYHESHLGSAFCTPWHHRRAEWHCDSSGTCMQSVSSPSAGWARGCGDRGFVWRGFNRNKAKVCGWPRSTMPPHCFQLAAWDSSDNCLPRSTSPASTSHHSCMLLNWIAFCFISACCEVLLSSTHEELLSSTQLELATMKDHLPHRHGCIDGSPPQRWSHPGSRRRYRRDARKDFHSAWGLGMEKSMDWNGQAALPEKSPE